LGVLGLWGLVGRPQNGDQKWSEIGDLITKPSMGKAKSQNDTA
jgi:hypothetical protein